MDCERLPSFIPWTLKHHIRPVADTNVAISLDNKGFQMLTNNMGWNIGDGLGSRNHGIVEPVRHNGHSATTKMGEPRNPGLGFKLSTLQSPRKRVTAFDFWGDAELCLTRDLSAVVNIKGIEFYREGTTPAIVKKAPVKSVVTPIDFWST